MIGLDIHESRLLQSQLARAARTGSGGEGNMYERAGTNLPLNRTRTSRQRTPYHLIVELERLEHAPADSAMGATL